MRADCFSPLRVVVHDFHPVSAAVVPQHKPQVTQEVGLFLSRAARDGASLGAIAVGRRAQIGGAPRSRSRSVGPVSAFRRRYLATDCAVARLPLRSRSALSQVRNCSIRPGQRKATNLHFIPPPLVFRPFLPRLAVLLDLHYNHHHTVTVRGPC